MARARDEAVKRGAAARLLSTMQLPWRFEDTFTDPTATIAVGLSSASVTTGGTHGAPRLGLLVEGLAATLRLSELEQEAMRRVNG